MGYMRHHAIVVTAADHGTAHKAIHAAHDFATRNGGTVSPIVKSPVNGYQSFALFPDGSKEGWEESGLGDERRVALIAFMDRQRYEDGSSPLAWVEVQYGDDDLETKIGAHSDQVSRLVAGELV